MERKMLYFLVFFFSAVPFLTGTLAFIMPTNNNIDNNDMKSNNVPSIPIPIPMAISVAEQRNPEEESPYIEGDILEDKIPSKSGYTSSEKHWRDGQVPYEISNSFTAEEVDKIRAAMKKIEDNTCVTFHERESDEKDYVLIVNDKTGCSSYVGFQGGAQALNLAPSCLRSSSNNPTGTGTACHELIHALGYRHEHCRHDRDEHITVVWDNVKPGSEINFRILPDTDSYNVRYDHNSVMHYSPTAFAVNSGQPTIVANDELEEGVKMGQRSAPTELDYLKVNKMYKCHQVRNRNRHSNRRR